MSLIVIVDRDNKVIGRKSRNDITSNDIYQVSVLWIKNRNNQVLLAQRAFTKSHSPGKWGPAVAGTVESDESFIDNIVKETREELGIHVSANDLHIGPLKYNQNLWKYFSQSFVFTTKADTDMFTIEEKEVSQIKWFTIDQIDELVNTQPDLFTESFPSTWSAIRPHLYSTPVKP